jgi:hypothetical protein
MTPVRRERTSPIGIGQLGATVETIIQIFQRETSDVRALLARTSAW